MPVGRQQQGPLGAELLATAQRGLRLLLDLLHVLFRCHASSLLQCLREPAAGLGVYQMRRMTTTAAATQAGGAALDTGLRFGVGWEPKVGLDEGLRLTLDYFLKRVVRTRLAS